MIWTKQKIPVRIGDFSGATTKDDQSNGNHYKDNHNKDDDDQDNHKKDNQNKDNTIKTTMTKI